MTLRDTLSSMTAADLDRWANEALDPEFKPYVTHGTVVGGMIQHPLVYDIGMVLPGLANRRLAQKKGLLEKAIEENDLNHIIVLHERPWRLWALLKYGAVRDDDDRVLPIWSQDATFREIASWVWTDSENIHQHQADWLELYRDRPEGAMLFGVDGKAAAKEFRKLPDPVPLFRGGDPGSSFLSWTTKREVAQKFATRHDHDEPDREVRERLIPKADIFAFYTHRNEFEALSFVGQGE